MLATFGFLDINDLQTAPLNDDLSLQRVPFFFLNNTLFGPFEGGLSGFPSHQLPRTELRPIFS
jgi:hypothetical protein